MIWFLRSTQISMFKTIETKSNQISIKIKFLLSEFSSKSVSLSFNLTTNNQLSNGNPIKIKSF